MNKSRKFAALTAICIMLMLACTQAYAQDDEPGMYLEDVRSFYAGLILGSNFAQVDGDNFAGYRKVGLNVGGIGYFQLRKHLAISWEILYSMKGAKSNSAKFSQDTNIIITKYNIDANYAEVPLMLNYFDKRKSHFGAGFSFGRLVTSSESLETDPAVTIDLNKYPFEKNTFDFLAGAQLHLWKGLFLNIRFQYSLMPMRTVSPPRFARTQQQYNNVWSVRLMYLFI